MHAPRGTPAPEGAACVARAARRAACLLWAGVLTVLLAACATPGREAAPPIDVETAQREGQRAYAEEDWDAAERHYRALVTAIPQDAALWFRLGNILAHRDQPDAAIGAYREALVRDGSLSKAWFNMGVVHLRQAANAFRTLSLHDGRGDDDAMVAQGTAAYDAIMTILGQHGQTDAALPPADAPDAPAP